MAGSRRSDTPSSSGGIIDSVWLNAFFLAISLVVSLLVTATLLWDCDPRAFARGMVAASLLPPMLGIPIMAVSSYRLRELRAANRKLEDFAHNDALTQLLNRGAFTRSVENKLAEMRSLPMARGALIIADADNFKRINDLWGHATGDEALRLIGLTMDKELHRDDVIGRLGGEEFGVFLYGSTPTSARSVAERLRFAVEEIDLRSPAGDRVPLTISLGGLHFGHPLPFATLYNVADRNLYRAKANGRNRCEFEEASVELLVEAA